MSIVSPPVSGRITTPIAFRLLIWLKWTLLLRAYSRQPMRVVGAVLMVILFVPLSVGAGVVCYLFGHDHSSLPPILMRAVLSIAYVVWLVTPLLGFPLNESYDPSKLFPYPVPVRTIFAANVVGGLFEISTLIALPVIVSTVLLFYTGFLAAVISTAAVLLFLIHTMAMAQFIMLSLIGFLRSRRFRDITIVVLPLIAVTFYIGQQAITRGMVNFDPSQILTGGVWRIADWLPPGWTAHAAADAGAGDYVGALFNLALLAVVVAVPIFLAAAMLNSLYLGDRGPAVAAGEATAVGSDRALFDTVSTGSAHNEIFALVRKERAYLIREPAYKALAVNTLYTLAAMFFAFFNAGAMTDHSIWQTNGYAGGDAFGPMLWIRVIRVFMLPTILLLATLPLTFNIFGGDASAITVLLAFPTPRWKIIAAKNIAYAPVVVGLCAFGVIIGAILMQQTAMLPLALAWILIAVPVVIGTGNLVSVWFPHKLMVRGQRWGRGGQVSFGSGPTGCGYGFLYLLCYLGSFAILTPVAAAIIAPLLFDDSGVLVYTIPLALVYSAAVYWGATVTAIRLLGRREPEIVARLAPDE